MSKEFSGEWVCHDIVLSLKRGEVHVLLDKNGGGKPTLIKILIGRTHK